MSVRFKRAAAGVLAPTGFFRFRGVLKARARQRLLLLGYHRVLPLPGGSQHAGDVELVSATPAEFAWQVEYLSRRFEPVTFAQIADACEGRAALPGRAVAITFDDGFADVYEHAFPILERHDMPATVFVATDYLDEPRPFWFDLVAWLVMHAPAGSIEVPGKPPLPADASERARRTAASTVLSWLKRCEERDRNAAVERLCGRFPKAAADAAAVLGAPMTWAQVREMAAGDIEFGSHTVSHRCLAMLEPKELEHELVASKARLEQQLRVPAISLSYPFGGPAAFNAAVVAVAKRAGYRVATSYVPGVNELATADRFALKRQHVERYTSRSYFEALVNAPELFD
jgi:peptidoglycan/xylan/chitin deacetylase (PgdA/CDA1 family)